MDEEWNRGKRRAKLRCKKKKNEERTNQRKMCIHFAIQHALLPFICRKISNKFTFTLCDLFAAKSTVPTIGVVMLLCMKFHAQMNKTKQSRAKKMFIIDIMKMVKSFVALFLHCVLFEHRTDFSFFSSILRVCDDDIIAFILGCE